MYNLLSLLISSFIAGSFFPMSSEAHLLYLQQQETSILALLLTASVGNSLGSMTCYLIARYGGRNLVKKLFRHNDQKIDFWKKKVEKNSDYWALLCWLPFIGEVIASILGLISNHSYRIFFFMFLGKLVRYGVVVKLGQFVF